jgi:hypothetical protein
MKKIFLIHIALFSFFSVLSQEKQKELTGYSIGASYTQEFVLDGFVKVREWELEGDKMNLKDLGMSNYPAVQIFVEKKWNKNRSITLSYDHYFMRGSANFDRDIAYNGTLINGRKGIDVSPTRYYRLSANYSATLWKKKFVELQYSAGLVYDRCTFYLDGEVSESSTRNEVYEGFGKQALPYPVVGLKGIGRFGEGNTIIIEVGGTYIPRFKSFFNEGGPIYLQYSNFEADVNYTRSAKKFDASFGMKLRTMHLLQESEEDTNELKTVTAGPYVEIVYNF